MQMGFALNHVLIIILQQAALTFRKSLLEGVFLISISLIANFNELLLI